MNISLSDHFTYRKLLTFTLPSIVMMIFTSVYGVVDGFFVSNYVGKTSFTAVNLIMPFLMILGALGFMFGAGGSALISKTMGEGDHKRAVSIFSMLVYIAAALGILIAAAGIIFIKPIAALLGADGQTLEDCVSYGRVILIALPAFILQYAFQSFFITAQKPQLGLVVTVAAGFTNIILDWLLVGVLSFGLKGAAAATAASQAVGGIVPLFYFAGKNTSLLRLTKPVFDGKALLKTCTNGSSELLSNISMSLVSMLYNVQLIKHTGEDGVAAYGVLMYVNLVFLAVFIGYSTGTAPVIGFHFGAEKYDELKSLLKKSLVIIGISSAVMFTLSEMLAKTLAGIFFSYDEGLMSLTLRAFRIYSFSFLFAGLAVFGSSYFTALNDGWTSAVIAFLRTMVFQAASVIILPIFLKTDGIWLSIVIAEFAAAALSAGFIAAKSRKHSLPENFSDNFQTGHTGVMFNKVQ